MKPLIVLFFFSLASGLSAQVLDSTKTFYNFSGASWNEITATYWSQPKRVTWDTLNLCGPGHPTMPQCDSLKLRQAVISTSANAWQEWAGYKALSQSGLKVAKSVQRDAVGFFQSLLGSSGAFVKAQNDLFLPGMAGRYSITTPDMPSTDFNLVQVPSGAGRFVMVSDTTITMAAIATSNTTIRFREKRHARAVLIVTGVNQLTGDQLNVNGTTLTEGVQWTASGGISATANSLAGAIDALANLTAKADGSVITITYDKPGPGGNAVALSYVQGTGNGLTLSGNSLSGGSNTEETWDVGIEYTNANSKPVLFDEGKKVKLVKKQ